MKGKRWLSIALIMLVFLFAGSHDAYAIDYIKESVNSLAGYKVSATVSKPAAVEKLTATKTTSSITLSWSKVSGATGYQIQKYDTSKKKYVTVDTTGKTTYKFSKLKSATEYKYRVRAYKTVNSKKYYSEYKTISVGTKPATISKITITNKTNYIKLKWNSVDRATGYKIYVYNSKTEKYDSVATVNGSTTYTVKNLSAGTAYKFCVKAYFKLTNGNTVFGDKKVVKTATAPNTPTLKVSAGINKATLSWSKVSCTGYEILYSQNDDFSNSKKIVVSGSSNIKTTIKSLSSNKKYYFKIRAYKTADDNKIYGIYSDVKSVTIKASSSVSTGNNTANDGDYYITETGAKYHASSCRYLDESKIKISLKDAQAQGYTACKVCLG